MPRPSRDVAIAVVVMGWIGGVLVADDVLGRPGRGLGDPAELGLQVTLGVTTWAVLALLLRREAPVVRVQTVTVVALATLVEYTFSPLLEAYTYRIGTVPFFVPPGHGLVYLGALALGRSAGIRRHARAAVTLTVVVGGAWMLTGLTGLLHPGRYDVLGAFWFACLLGFLAWGRSRLLYVGAFVVVGYLEIVGTALGTWAWAPTDPVLHLIGQGNPPSGAAGGYGWFDLWAILAAPHLMKGWRRLSGALGQRREDLVVEEAVGGDGVPAEGPVLARE